MKKSLIIGLLGLACGVVSSFGQGAIRLDNYDTGGPIVTYGSPGIAANGAGGGGSGVVGTGLLAGWTLGFYYTIGDVTGSVGTDPSGSADPFTLGGGLALATGSGSTAAFYTTSFNTPGEAFSAQAFLVPGTPITGGTTLTLVMIAYSGPSYISSGYRAHSAAFTMTTSQNTSPNYNAVGSYMPAFSIVVPEPSIAAFAGLGAGVFVFLRRRK